MRPEDLLFFAKYIEEQLGIVYSETNYFQLQNRLQEIAKVLGLPSTDDLVTMAKNQITGHFKQLLLDSSTNNETSFFRDLKLFEAFKSDILPKVLAQKPGQTIRIWSAASSTGQEAYSLAMLAHEYKSIKDFKFEIVGTDISDKALNRAIEAKYSQLEVNRGLLPHHIQKYFKQNADGVWSVNSEIKAYTKFQKLNLCHPFSNLGQFDIIFCRNVLIYQRIEKKSEIIKRLGLQLNTGGILVLGAGESLIGISQDFNQREINNTIVYEQKKPILEAAG